MIKHTIPSARQLKEKTFHTLFTKSRLEVQENYPLREKPTFNFCTSLFLTLKLIYFNISQLDQHKTPFRISPSQTSTTFLPSEFVPCFPSSFLVLQDKFIFLNTTNKNTSILYTFFTENIHFNFLVYRDVCLINFW